MNVSRFLYPFKAAKMADLSSSSVSGVTAVMAIIMGLAASKGEKSISTRRSSSRNYSRVRKVASLKICIGRWKISMKSLTAFPRIYFCYLANILKRNVSRCSALVSLQMFRTSSARNMKVKPTTYDTD